MGICDFLLVGFEFSRKISLNFQKRSENDQKNVRWYTVLKGTFWPEIFFLATSQKLTPKFSAFFVVFVGKEITINIVQN